MRSNDAFRPFLEKYIAVRTAVEVVAHQRVSVASAVLPFSTAVYPEVVQQSNAPTWPLKSSLCLFAPRRVVVVLSLQNLKKNKDMDTMVGWFHGKMSFYEIWSKL